MQADAEKVLIIGGYGTFGGWLARLLSDDHRLHLLIAGRSVAKASAFVTQYQRAAEMTPVRFDRDDEVEAQLLIHAADYVVDASGPFQAYGEDPYRVASACIACGANYLDFADGTQFVLGIEVLNEDARARGVFALSGASTCVALTSSVFNHLSKNMSQVSRMHGGIAPSPFSGVGFSVMRAVAISAGRPADALVDGRIQNVYPFTESRRITIAPPGYLPLRPRTFSLVDVPDLLTAKMTQSSTKSVWFGAAPVPAAYHAILRILARAVKRGWLQSLEFLAPFMTWIMGRFSWGEHRGGMFIEVSGNGRDGETLTRSWHLIAEGDDGPSIPAMAGAAIITRCLDGESPLPGARPAVNVLPLDAFSPFFKRMDIHVGERETSGSESWPIFRQVLGAAWNDLPKEISQLHAVSGTHHFDGDARVTRGESIVARSVARIIGFPPAGENIPLHVQMRVADGREYWSRDFDGHKFSSVMSAGQGRSSNLLCERFGIAKFSMALVLDRNCLRYVPRSWTVLGIPMPVWLAPQGKMREFVEDGVFHFHVEIKLPIIGNIVTYQGWLESTDAPA